MADFGGAVPSWHISMTPLSCVYWFLYGTVNAKACTESLMELIKTIPEMQKEYESFNCKVLNLCTSAPYQLLTKKPVREEA